MKLFPADTLGPTYIKRSRAAAAVADHSDWRRDDENRRRLYQGRLRAVAAGSSLVSKDVLAKKDWKSLTEISRQFVEAVAVARKG